MARIQKVKQVITENAVPERADFGTVFVCKDTQQVWVTILSGEVLNLSDLLEGKTAGVRTPGPRGAQGEPGNDGRHGTPGKDSHVPGPKGDPSTVPGPKGEQGNTGRDGKDGKDSVVPGPTGKDGRDGKDSVVPGPQGGRGEQGIPGRDGQDGQDSIVQGPKGIKGDKGDRGDTGAQGRNGRDGKNGQDGKDSIVPGPAGKDSTVPGPKGEPGDITVIGDAELHAAVLTLRAEKAKYTAALYEAFERNGKRRSPELRTMVDAVLRKLKADANVGR